MAIRLIRKASDTPNVTNTDDARMVRYAYGGFDGYIKGRGDEIGYSVSGTVFTITSGVLVLQGWESEIDSNGWSVSVDNIATKRYYTAYYEVNRGADTAEIKSVYDTGGFPEISQGDDLTATSNGTARLPLYHFSAQNGVVGEVQKIVNEIIYAKAKFADIDERLERLGFKSGSITMTEGNATANILERQGNYVIGQLVATFDPSLNVYYPVGIVPEEFRPKTVKTLKGSTTARLMNVATYSVDISIYPNGEIKVVGGMPDILSVSFSIGFDASI